MAIEQRFSYKNTVLRIPDPIGTPLDSYTWKSKLPLVSRRCDLARRWQLRGIHYGYDRNDSGEFGRGPGTPFTYGTPWISSTLCAGLSLTEALPIQHPQKYYFWNMKWWQRTNEPYALGGGGLPTRQIPSAGFKWMMIVEAAIAGIRTISGSGPSGTGSGWVVYEGDVLADGTLSGYPSGVSYSSPHGAMSSTRNVIIGCTRDGATIPDSCWGAVWWN